jgi:protease-4
MPASMPPNPPTGYSFPQLPPPQPPRRRGGGAWRVIKILLVIFLVVGLLVSMLGNLALVAALSLSGGGIGGEDGAARVAQETVHRGGRQKIAILPARGAVDDEMAARIQRYIAAIRADSEIRAVVLEVDSPGGSITASDDIHHMLTQLHDQNYKIYVSMRGLAASGGYYISMPADKIFAEPTTMTGSIGVIWPAFEMAGLLEKIGITPEIITSSKATYKDAASPFKKFTDEDRAYIRGLVNDAHEKFVHIVDAGRRGKLKAPLDQIAIGRVWGADEALRLGLIDEIAYLDDVCTKLAADEGIADPTIVRLKDRAGLLDLLSASSRMNQGKITLDPKLIYELQTPRMEFRYVDPSLTK